MKKLDDTKNKIPLWFHIFIIAYLISFSKKINLEILKYVAIVFVQIIAIVNVKNNKVLLPKKSLFLLVVLDFSMLLSLINSSYLMTSMIKTISIIDMLLTTTILLPNILKKYKKEDIIRAIRNDIFIVLLVYFIIFRNDYISGTNIAREGKAIRYMFGFIHPNTLGMFSFIGCVFSLFLLFFDKNQSNKNKNRNNIIIILFFTYIIYLSDSKTALYCLIIYILLNLVNKVSNYFKNKIIPILIYVFIGFLILIASENEYKITYDNINLLLSNRLYYYNQAINVLLNSGKLLIGVGAYTNASTWETNNVMIDNGYLNYLYQFGLISFICLVIFLVYNYILIKKSNSNIEIRQFLINLYICFLIYSFLENILINISSLFAIIIYLLIYAINQEEDDEDINNNSRL